MVVVELWSCVASHRDFRLLYCCSPKGHRASEPKYHKSFVVSLVALPSCSAPPTRKHMRIEDMRAVAARPPKTQNRPSSTADAWLGRSGGATPEAKSHSTCIIAAEKSSEKKTSLAWGKAAIVAFDLGRCLKQRGERGGS